MSELLLCVIYFTLGFVVDRWVCKPRLQPGLCECGHERCAHKEGRGPCECHLSNIAKCACDVFIRDKHAVERGVDPEVAQLRKMAGIKL